MTANGVISWSGTVTALTSIAHAGETRGTISLLRRERIIQPDDSSIEVPIISGNSLRGRLRRIAEELLRDVLCYDGQLTPSAAHALRSGGSLTKIAGEPLSGSRLANVRAHLPLVGVFGAAAGGRIIDGCLNVGKLIPLVTETDHITGRNSSLSSFEVVQLEYYTRLDDTDTHSFPDTITTPGTQPENQMLYRLETFKAGTRFQLEIDLNRPTPLEAAFFTDVLAAFTANPRIGGRLAVGLGKARVDLTCSHPYNPLNWADYLRDHREQAMTALAHL